MSRARTRAALIGMAIAVLYVVGSLASGAISPLARRPVFDGFASPPPYRWVSPPPKLAAGNFKPESGTLKVKFARNGKSSADVLSTGDIQATLILSDGAFVASAGQASAELKIAPLALDPSAKAPPGLAFLGNVYRVSATYQPSGTAIPALAVPGQLTLVAPPSLDGLIHAHVLLSSSDGKSWTALPTNDAVTQVAANVISLGYFVLSQRVAGGKKPFPLGRLIYYGLIGAVVLVIGVPILLHEMRTRRTRRSRRAARHRQASRTRRR